MPLFRGPRIYGGYGIYGGDEPDLRDYRTHPVIEQQLLDPSSKIWELGNIFLRLHPEYLYPCLGERIVRAADAQAAPAARKQATRELESLRTSIRKYFKRTLRRPGRPSKLTPIDRDRMADEHDRLRDFIRVRCPAALDLHVPHEDLTRLFRNADFQHELFSEFPLKQGGAPASWNAFLKDTASLGISERALRYLALRYGVSRHTIHRAIWPAGPANTSTSSPA